MSVVVHCSGTRLQTIGKQNLWKNNQRRYLI